jgi:ribonuclease HI
MTPDPPQYLLFTEALRSPQGRVWRFLLLKMGTSHSIDASDLETEGTASRTELLALVRGLEAIEEPARVKLVTGSRYLQRGLSRGLTSWAAQEWHWERFGRRVPVRDADLWQRVSRALEYHQVDCHSLTLTIGASPQGAQVNQAAGAAVSAESEPAVLVVRQARPRRAKGNSVVAKARQTITGVRRGLETLWDAELAPTG